LLVEKKQQNSLEFLFLTSHHHKEQPNKSDFVSLTFNSKFLEISKIKDNFPLGVAVSCSLTNFNDKFSWSWYKEDFAQSVVWLSIDDSY
jgi:hypothetical protein